MRQILSILQLRILQLTRLVSSGGWRAVVAFPLFMFAAIMGIKSLTNHGAMHLNLVVCVLLYLVEATRKDTAFIFLLKKTGTMLRLVEYTAIILLCNAYATTISAGNILYIFGDILFALLLVNFPAGKRAWKIPDMARTITSILPRQMYELKFSFRQLFLLILPLWALSLIASFLGPVLPFAVIIISGVMFDHICYMEPWEITQSHGQIANVLNRKMQRLALAIFLFFLPQLVITFYYWYSHLLLLAVLGAFWVALSTIYYSLLLRYAGNGSGFNPISKSFRVLLFLVATPLPPLSIYLLYKQYKTAKCNLQPLLA